MKRRVLWFAMAGGVVLVVLAYSTFTAVNRHQNTLRLVEVVKQGDRAEEAEVRSLLAGGADPNASLTPAPFTMMDVLRTTFHLSRHRDLSESLVMHAAGCCNDYVLRDILDAGGEIHSTFDEQTPLVAAVNSGRHRNVGVLVQYRADVNLSCPMGTPLTVAAVVNHLEDVSFLIAHGADPNRFDAKGEFPLMCAAALDRAEVMDALLRAGAKVNLRDSDGDTPLMWSAHSGKVDALVSLLAAGADPTLRNYAGKTAEQIAIGRGGMKAARILHNYRRVPTDR